MSQFDVYIINNLIRNGGGNNSALENAKAKLAQRFKLSPDKADALLRQPKVVIKRGVSEEMANKLATAIEQCGLKAELVSLSNELDIGLSLEPFDEPEPPVQQKSAYTSSESSAVTHQTPPPKDPNPSTEEPPTKESASEQQATDDAIYNTPTASTEKDVFCRQCGSRMAASAKACSNCGALATQQGEGPSKIAAGFLAFFLGGFGVHRFYLRQWWGVFYIPFGLLSVAFPVTLIEAIYFWAMSNTKWQEKYGHLPKSSAVVIIAICIVPFIAVVGILAAIALPAYQDYTHRAKVSEGLIELRSKAREFESVAVQTDSIPLSFTDAGVSPQVNSQHLQSIELDDAGSIVGTFTPLSTTSPAMTIVLVPSYQRDGNDITTVSWSCSGGTMPDKFRPRDCRGGSDATSPQKAVSGTKLLRSTESSATLQVPSSWREGVAENAEASINAGNTYREAYVLLLEEEDDDAYFSGLIDYVPAVEDYYASALTDYQLISRENVTSEEGRPGKLLKFNAREAGYDITYMVALYQDRSRYYQVFTWSLRNKFAQNEADFKDVMTSFHP